jgi:hypothetical protein
VLPSLLYILTRRMLELAPPAGNDQSAAMTAVGRA